MEVIAGDRRSGKSTKIAKWVLEDRDNRAVVVRNTTIVNMYKSLGLRGNEIIVANNVAIATMVSERKLAIDDAELTLLIMASIHPSTVEVLAFTANTILKTEEAPTVKTVFVEEKTKWANHNG